MSKKKRINRIAIIGLGLIGGSLAKALKARGYYIVGIDKKESTLKIVKKQKVINKGYTKLNKQALKNVSLIFLATPLSSIPFYIKEIAKTIKHDVILTDTGSTKQEICKIAKKILPRNITFIGGHPMSGTEKQGFKFSDRNLFKSCMWLLTPSSKTSRRTVKTLEKIIRQVGAKVLTTTPEEHDKSVCLVSHLPLLASIGLCETVRSIKDKKLGRLAEAIVSSGFRDTTRIAGGNPELNYDLITSNLPKLEKLLPKYFEELGKMVKLAKEKPSKLEKDLSIVSMWRSSL